MSSSSTEGATENNRGCTALLYKTISNTSAVSSVNFMVDTVTHPFCKLSNKPRPLVFILELNMFSLFS